MSKLSQQLNQQNPSSTEAELNGFIENSPIYVTSYPPGGAQTGGGSQTSVATSKAGPTSTTTTPGSTPGKSASASEATAAVVPAQAQAQPAILQQQQQQPKPLSNGGAGILTAASLPPDDQEPELELKQELKQEELLKQEDVPEEEAKPKKKEELVGGRRRSSSATSAFTNGGTEVLLIGQDVQQTAAAAAASASLKGPSLLDNTLKPNDDYVTRPRRRSGGSEKERSFESGSEVQEVVEEGEGGGGGDPYNMMVVMASMDNGPHRELPVDVPETFMPRNKTPPRYPPPRPHARHQPPPPLPLHNNQQGGVNGSAVGVGKGPVPPPRTEPIRSAVAQPAPPPPPPPASRSPTSILNNNNTEPPTKQQLDSIRKFQEQLRKRKEDEDKAAQQEMLNRSLRGSKKLQALESVANHQLTGLVNDGFTPEEPPPLPPQPAPKPHVQPSLHRLVGYGEVVASLQRLQLALKKCGIAALEAQVSAIQTLVLTPEFGRALATHNKVQQSWPSPPPQPATEQAQTLARDCVESLQNSALPEAVELTELLSRYEFEGLLYSHDHIARELAPLVGVAKQQPPPPQPPIQAQMPPAGESQIGPRQAPPPAPPPASVLQDQLPKSSAQDEDSNIKIIKIEKTNEPLGATVRNEGESVMIGRVVRGGAAEKSGLLHEGDEVLEVNGIEMRGKSVNEVCDLLSTMTGTLTFIIVPSRDHRAVPRDTLLHMKANFDYDPEEDLYIPCRELGISFQKGDVLHVICQDDPNWWQAYREGEEDQTLAGLIPSKSFQHQRESMKQAITGERMGKEKSKKAGTFLCAKKNQKKKKKKSPYGGYDSGYPMYAANADDYDVDEILTYDEVALYYPRANHKRPIVLIGPPNIGRHELRQRLMEDSERFAAAVPHTSRSRKEGEVDGQDYHFITRAQFEADILARKFVEHGEYEKAYYGTSLDAIRSVVSAGKICVLNLHPQSLRILRSSDLKPYVVFVAPPSLEKLRQKKLRNGEAFKEEELKDIIEKAREMEDKYGHYFDMIINNNDTDRAYHQLLHEINIIEREPQWVPAAWVKNV